jgi:hypothetical protein
VLLTGLTGLESVRWEALEQPPDLRWRPQGKLIEPPQAAWPNAAGATRGRYVLLSPDAPRSKSVLIWDERPISPRPPIGTPPH